jgi:hypothetical protein
MTTLTTLSDGETYADVRLGETFIVSVDRSAHEDALTVRVFHPDEPETAIGEHCLDLSLDEENGETTVETDVAADPTTSDEVALG